MSDTNDTQDKDILSIVAEPTQAASDTPPPQPHSEPNPLTGSVDTVDEWGTDDMDFMDGLPPEPPRSPIFDKADTVAIAEDDEDDEISGGSGGSSSTTASKASDDVDTGFDEIDLLNLFNLLHSYILKYFTGSDNRAIFQVPEEDIEDIGRQLRPFMPKVKSKVPKGLILFATIAMIIAPMWIMAFSMRKENMRNKKLGSKGRNMSEKEENSILSNGGAAKLPKMDMIGDDPPTERTNFKIHANGVYTQQWNGKAYTYVPTGTAGTVSVNIEDAEEVCEVIRVNSWAKLKKAFMLDDNWLMEKHGIEIGK